MSVWLPLIQRALLISGISGRDRCRDKIGWRSHLRLLMHTGAKQRLRSRIGEYTGEGLQSKDVMYRVGTYFTHLASNNTPSHQDLPLRAYEVSARSGLSMSSEALTQMHVYTHVPSLSRKARFIITRLAVNPDCRASVKETHSSQGEDLLVLNRQNSRERNFRY